MSDLFDSHDNFIEQIPEIISILPVFDIALFPKMVLPLVVHHKSAIQLIDDAMSRNRIIGVLLSKKTHSEGDYSTDDLHNVGSLAMILKMAKSDNNKVQLMVQGLGRYKINEFINDDPYLQARVETLKNIDSNDKQTKALMNNALNLYQKIIELSPGLPPEIGEMANSIPDPGTLADMIK